MIPAPDLLLFFGIVFGVVILPGLDMAFILGSALLGGRALGFAAVAGIVAGGICHVTIGGLGIAIVLRIFPAAFSALLGIGAAYMAWIGISLWKSGATLGQPEGAILPSKTATFRRAALTNLLNPKAYAFMLAIFPQFVRADHGPIATQALELGTIIPPHRSESTEPSSAPQTGRGAGWGFTPRSNVASREALGCCWFAPRSGAPPRRGSTSTRDDQRVITVESLWRQILTRGAYTSR
ncbi:MAG: LysE family translocator [Acidobacteriota bacterium]